MPDINPEVLKYGALGLMFVGLVLAGTIVFSSRGARGAGQYRLVVTFMFFALALVGMAVGAEMYKSQYVTNLMAAEARAVALETRARVAEERRDELTTANTVVDQRLADVIAGTKEQVAALVANIDGKWCAEVLRIEDGFIKEQSIRFLTQMRASIAAIQNLIGVEAGAQVTLTPDCQPG